MAHQVPRSIARRRLMAATAAGASVLGAPAIVRAQPAVLKVGLLLPRSGYLAAPGQSCHRGALVAPKVLSAQERRPWYSAPKLCAASSMTARPETTWDCS